MLKKLILVFCLMLGYSNLFAVKNDLLNDIVLRERAEESQVGKFLREEKKLDNIRGNVGIDIFGNRVRTELYLLSPASNQLRGMLLTYRENSLNYGWVLTTYKKDLPPIFELKNPKPDSKEEREYRKKLAEFRDLAWEKISSDLDNYATRIEFYASNERDYIKEIYDDGFIGFSIVNNSYQLRFRNYKRVINDITKVEMELLKDDSEFYDNPYYYDSSEIKWTFAGGSRSVEEMELLKDDPEFIEGKILEKDFSNEIDILRYDAANVKYGDGTWEKWTNLLYEVKDRIWAGGGMQETGQEMIYTASEFEGRKIDLVSGGFPEILTGQGDLLTGRGDGIYDFSPGFGYLSFFWRSWLVTK